jgi:pantoate--beta-alanine ligase
MGAFHEGHLALIRTAIAECDLVVVSLFVNPLQFGPDEDLARYPRAEDRDARLAAEAGADLFFAPTVEEMYPPGFGTTVDAGPVGRTLEGAARPGHFQGVATIVTRLLGIVAPDAAYFGQKDHQQVAVLRRVLADLALPTELRVVPTVRDADGLALSSRNAYLSAGERALAVRLGEGLAAAGDAFADGERSPDALRSLVLARLDAPGIEVDYVELRDAETLDAYEPARAAAILAAIRVGETRLIDNLVLPPSGAPALVTSGGAIQRRDP